MLSRRKDCSKKIMRYIFGLILFLHIQVFAFEEDLIFLNVNLNSIPTSEGYIIYDVYDNEFDYKAKSHSLISSRVTANKGELNLKLAVPKSGFYAFVAFHDANSNGILDRNIIGMPKEVFGISNITRKLWSDPKWDEVKFLVNPDIENTINIKMKYQ